MIHQYDVIFPITHGVNGEDGKLQILNANDDVLLEVNKEVPVSASPLID